MEGLGHDRKSLWIGPVQGGKYLDLVTTSARYLSSMPFDMFALGSPTEIMERYDFTLLAQMIVTAKKALPLDKPLHLFGLGHPLPLAMAVALGCDTFDSASYVLYARAGRYITETGTRRIQDLEYLPCVCRVCSKISAKQLNEMEVDQRQNKIAIHNLYMLKREIEATKQALREGRLWEYLGVRAKAHPNLWAAFEELAKNSDSFEVFTPSFKFRGLMLSSYPDHLRPEIRRANDRLVTYLSSRPSRPLLILPEGRAGPFVYGKVYERASSALPIPFMIGYISVPVGFVPGEISDVYPFSQIVNSPGLQGDPRIMDQFIKVLTVQLRSLAPSMTFLVRDELIHDPSIYPVFAAFAQRFRLSNSMRWKSTRDKTRLQFIISICSSARSKQQNRRLGKAGFGNTWVSGPRPILTYGRPLKSWQRTQTRLRFLHLPSSSEDSCYRHIQIILGLKLGGPMIDLSHIFHRGRVGRSLSSPKEGQGLSSTGRSMKEHHLRYQFLS